MTLKPRKSAVDASLFVQVLAMMVGGLIVAQMINLIVLYNLPPPSPEIHGASEVIRRYMGQPLSPDRPTLVTRDVATPPRQIQRLTDYGVEFRKDLVKGIKAAGGPDIDYTKIITYSSSERWFRDRAIRLSRNRMGLDTQNERFLVAPMRVAIPTANGRWRVIQNEPGLKLDPWQQRALLSFAVTSLIVLVAAYLFTRRLTQPFSLLAEGAERLGRDPRASPLQVTGASEARMAARAFNDMQARLRRYVEDRTAMIGAIAHDLRTPLTRLRFRIEVAPEELRGKMSSDLDQMEAMISATLSFVRDATEVTQRTKLELSSLLESLTDEMTDTRADVVMERSDKVIVEGDPLALKRLFTNLLENAVKYGARARVRVFKDGDAAVVEIDDDGPGVPESERERVFEPFYRREPSRNRDTGGIGLGLAVVRTVARAHGGDAELENRPGGGLTAKVRLPL